MAKVLSSLAVSAQDAAGPFIRDIMPVLLEVLNSGNKVRSKGRRGGGVAGTHVPGLRQRSV